LSFRSLRQIGSEAHLLTEELQLQFLLVWIGYNLARVDVQVGAGTANAVKDHQTEELAPQRGQTVAGMSETDVSARRLTAAEWSRGLPGNAVLIDAFLSQGA